MHRNMHAQAAYSTNIKHKKTQNTDNMQTKKTTGRNEFYLNYVTFEV